MIHLKKQLMLVNLLLVLFGCVACTKDSDSMGGGNNSTKKRIVGTWIDTNDKLYYYLNDGNGYTEYTKSDDGVFRRAFEWTLEEDVLTEAYAKDDYFADANISHIVSFDSEGHITLTNTKNNKQATYRKINDKGTTSVKYNNPPFINYVRIYGYYYELSKAVMRCEHGNGTQSNGKYLNIFGANELMSPIGVWFNYFTPYYEGIDKEWADGTYKLSTKSSHWVYGGAYTYKGNMSGRCDGKLTIKTSGKIKYFDFNLDSGDAVGHFEGTWSYSN